MCVLTVEDEQTEECGGLESEQYRGLRSGVHEGGG